MTDDKLQNIQDKIHSEKLKIQEKFNRNDEKPQKTEEKQQKPEKFDLGLIEQQNQVGKTKKTKNKKQFWDV